MSLETGWKSGILEETVVGLTAVVVGSVLEVWHGLAWNYLKHSLSFKFQNKIQLHCNIT